MLWTFRLWREPFPRFATCPCSAKTMHFSDQYGISEAISLTGTCFLHVGSRCQMDVLGRMYFPDRRVISGAIFLKTHGLHQCLAQVRAPASDWTPASDSISFQNQMRPRAPKARVRGGQRGAGQMHAQRYARSEFSTNLLVTSGGS